MLCCTGWEGFQCVCAVQWVSLGDSCAMNERGYAPSIYLSLGVLEGKEPERGGEKRQWEREIPSSKDSGKERFHHPLSLTARYMIVHSTAVPTRYNHTHIYYALHVHIPPKRFNNSIETRSL